MLRNDAEYQAALKDVEDVAGCLEQTPEERWLIRLLLQIEIYEAKLDVSAVEQAAWPARNSA